MCIYHFLYTAQIGSQQRDPVPEWLVLLIILLNDFAIDHQPRVVFLHHVEVAALFVLNNVAAMNCIVHISPIPSVQVIEALVEWAISILLFIKSNK